MTTINYSDESTITFNAVSGLGLLAPIPFIFFASLFSYIGSRTRLKWQPKDSHPNIFLRGLKKFYYSIFGQGAEKALEGVVTLIEAIKSIAVFLLCIEPDTMRLYTCGTPVDLIGEGPYETPFFITSDFLVCPRDDTTYGEGFAETFYTQFGFTATGTNNRGRAQLDAICGKVGFVDVWLVVMFIQELATLFYFFLWKKKMFQRAKFHAIIFYITSAMWAFWNVFFVFKVDVRYETTPRDATYCQVRFASLISFIFSLFHVLIGFCLWMGHLNNLKSKDSSTAHESP